MAAIGQEVPLKMHGSMPWILRRQVARDYVKGRLVLAGDAAHSFPPTGGLGLNSGLAGESRKDAWPSDLFAHGRVSLDAHNLAYKLAAVHFGYADLATVLRSYHEERHPVAVRNSMQSVTNGKKILALLKALKNTGPDPDVARKEMFAVLDDKEQLARVEETIEDQRSHFDNVSIMVKKYRGGDVLIRSLVSQLMLHIGYVYEPGWDPKDVADYFPTYRKGARLPHVWIEVAESARISKHLPPVDLGYLADELDPKQIAACRWSSLDLVDPSGWVILYDARGSQAERWSDDGSTWMEVKEGAARSHIPLRKVAHGRDFTLVDNAAGQTWLEQLGLTSGHAVIVRPDQHIAFIASPSESGSSIVSTLRLSLGLKEIDKPAVDHAS